MPRDISESSSDEEVAPPKNEARKPKRSSRYECPEDFTSMSYAPCQSFDRQSVFDENKELWLIKAPASFNPRSFAGMKLPLASLKTIQSRKDGASQQVFSVLGGRSTSSSLRLLTCDPEQPDAHLCAPAFSGVLNISESYGDCSSNQGPMAVPAAPAPKLPDGLRQRFLPFGSVRPASAMAPVTVAPEEATVPHMAVKIEPDASEETPRKRKKEKRIKQEVDAMATPAAVAVKIEQTSQSAADESTLVDGQITEERKKKKKKKDKERERVKTEEVEVPHVRVKEEPMDTSHVDSEPVHKKKKKKKSKGDD